MPRPLLEHAMKKSMIQARYRAKLSERKEPESDRVDTALASAVAAFADALENGYGNAEDQRVLRILLQSARSILKSDDYENDAIIKVMRRRLNRTMRSDLEQIVTDSKIRNRMTSRQ